MSIYDKTPAELGFDGSKQESFEYDRFPVGDLKMNEANALARLTTMGKAGWELVQIETYGALMKRRLSRTPAPATPASSWHLVSAETDNAVASVSKAGEAGKTHFITLIEGSFSGSGLSGKTLKLKSGGATLWAGYVGDARSTSFPIPVSIPVGQDATLELEAGGASVLGVVTLHGYTA